MHNMCTTCQMLAVDIPHLYASCLGTFDQKNVRVLANSKFIWSWNINRLARSPARNICLWMMWSGRHYMLPVIVLCHTLSFSWFSYLDAVFILFFFSSFVHLVSGYTALHHIYFMNDSYDPRSHLLLLSCLPLFIYSLCPPLTEIALFALRDVSSDTAAVVALFLLYIFSHLNSSDDWESLLLHISSTLSLKLFQEVSLHHLQIISFLFPIENITLLVRDKKLVSFPMVQFHSVALSWWTLTGLFSYQHLCTFFHPNPCVLYGHLQTWHQVISFLLPNAA